MKHTLFSIILLASAVAPCLAQWAKTPYYGANGYIAAFGIHDTTIFASEVTENGGTSNLLYRYTLSSRSFVKSQTGIDFSQGIITSFASLGKYAFAAMTRSDGSPGAGWSSSDGGDHWIANYGGFVYSNSQFVFTAAGTYGIYRSEDSGIAKTWANISSFPARFLGGFGACIFAANSTAVQRSLDTGNHWANVPSPFGGYVVTMDSIVFIISSSGQVAKSTNLGTDWSIVPVDSAGALVSVSCLTTDGKNLFAGTNKGVLVSSDAGEHWTAQNYGLDYAYAIDGKLHLTYNIDAIVVFDSLVFVDVQYSNGTGYITYRPISELTAPAGAVAQLPPNDTIEVYPIPTMDRVSIVSGDSRILGVRVLNVLGSETESVVRGPGSGNMELDLSKLPDATYFLEIETTKGIVLRKVVKE